MRMALVVFLRGVNVGGHRTFRPKVLAEQLRHLDVVNIGAAGTFVIRRRVRREALRAEIARRLPFDTEIMICEGRDIARLLSLDPFADQGTRPDVVRFVSVLSRSPSSAPELPLDLPGDGPWMLRLLARHGRFVLGVYRRQMKAIRYLSALDGVFGVPVTTRNWNTIAAIADVLDGPGHP
jgi:uncharacterized protein (DUF1697 family)